MKAPSVPFLLKKYGVRPKKRLGQNFLVPLPTMQKIVDALELHSDDVVIEIGPGLGVMTALAARRSSLVIAIDKDEQLVAIAKEEFGNTPNIIWMHADILKVSVEDLITDSAAFKCGTRNSERGIEPNSALRTQHSALKILGNLPYNISSPVLFWMLDDRSAIARAIVMLQKEVAMRLVASPGTKDYGILAVLFGAFADTKKLFDVSPKSFLPPPEVTSAVVRIDFREGKHAVDDELWFRRVVKAAFGQRRKTIRNAFLGAAGLKLDAERIDAALEVAGIDPKLRPERLSVETFAALANALHG